MNRPELSRIYSLVMATYHQHPSDAGIAAWWAALEDLDGDEAYAAALHLVKTLRYPPRPSEIREVVESAKGELAPDVEEALGYYMVGEWDVHPAVQIAATKVQWDRHQLPDKAEFEFRALYKRALNQEMTGKRRHALGLNPGGDATHIGDLLRYEPPEIDLTGDDQ